MATRLRDLSGPRMDVVRRFVRTVDNRTRDRLRRRAGFAEQRLTGSVTEQAADLGRTHQAMVRRRQGYGPLGDLLCEIYAHELNGRDTTEQLAAIIETQNEARARVGTLLDISEASQQEQRFDADEDVEQIGFHVSRCPRRWEAAARRHFAFMASHLFPAFTRSR